MAVTALNKWQQAARILAWVFFFEVVILGGLMVLNGGVMP